MLRRRAGCACSAAASRFRRSAYTLSASSSTPRPEQALAVSAVVRLADEPRLSVGAGSAQVMSYSRRRACTLSGHEPTPPR